jgi:hypothetical protein
MPAEQCATLRDWGLVKVQFAAAPIAESQVAAAGWSQQGGLAIEYSLRDAARRSRRPAEFDEDPRGTDSIKSRRQGRSHCLI